ncbi:MAG: ArsR family transcriptional regulator, arsenate/arsenite/antimonite-responsive transcriptional [Chloroflexia bacterium]|jgi:protein-tyrosine-phosphatase|nr:ArsR family transcriptional regulator, arsenate/arsenite/antimonite-responsive transcriptional [Chloroflexia bacterium]
MNSDTEQEKQAPVRVLFLCTHNSARSQLAEAILRHLGGEGVRVYSAGSEPSRVHHEAIRTLESLDISAEGLTSKHVKEFLGQDFDYVVTVCDQAREACPVFPGGPTQLHWSYPDPSRIADEAERRATFFSIATDLMERSRGLLAEIRGGR